MNALDASGPAARPAREYLAIPFRYPFHLWIPFLAIVLLAVAAWFVLPKKYRSSTLILVESARVSAAFDNERMVERLRTIKQEIESRTRLEQVIAELRPYERYADQSLSWKVERMRRSTQIRVQGNDAFYIEFVHTDPAMARDVTNRLASLFIENNGKLRERAVAEAHGFMESTLEESKKALEEAEEQLRRFKEKYMGALPEQLQANLATLSRLQMEKQTVASSIQAAEQRRSFVLNTIAQSPATPSADLLEIAKLRDALETLRNRYTEEHPDVVALKERIRRLESTREDLDRARRAEAASPDPPEAFAGETIASSPAPRARAALAAGDPTQKALQSSFEQTAIELARLERTLQDLDDQIARLQARVELTPRIEGELYALERNYKLRRENYDLMLQKKIEAEMAQNLEQYWKGELFRVLDPADLPERPASPNAFVLIAAGIFFGALAGIATCGIADYLDPTVRSVRELETLLPFPVLATVPHLRKSKKRAA